mmetsp:Transcript_3004/g.9356  ORF Transcript_3004/g.9356 Transcript_3004/m.9356 type:complete len:223 (+) Transcript_3004:3718-4386(+)
MNFLVNFVVLQILVDKLVVCGPILFVELRDRWIIPSRDFPAEDASERCAAEDDCLVPHGLVEVQVENGDDRAGYRRVEAQVLVALRWVVVGTAVGQRVCTGEGNRLLQLDVFVFLRFVVEKVGDEGHLAVDRIRVEIVRAVIIFVRRPRVEGVRRFSIQVTRPARAGSHDENPGITPSEAGEHQSQACAHRNARRGHLAASRAEPALLCRVSAAPTACAVHM